MTNQSFDYKNYDIIDKTDLGTDIFLFKLKGHIPFEPGQFVQAAIDHFGEGTFAICSDPKNKEFFELCIRGCGSTSNALINLLPGDSMKIRGPYGKGWPIKKLWWKDVILVAGGMGLVPLRPVIYEMIRDRINFEKIYLFAGFRSSEHILFENELKEWSKKFTKVSVVAEYAEDGFWGEKGMITEPLGKINYNAKKSAVFMCGPDVMTPFCNKVFFEKSLKESQIYISYERRMECGIGVCQHCNLGKFLVCKDGPVFRLDTVKTETEK